MLEASRLAQDLVEYLIFDAENGAPNLNAALTDRS